MASSRRLLSTSSTCCRCGYSSCICYKGASKIMPTEYAPFGIYPGGVPASQKSTGAEGYGDPTGKFRSEIDGLQAGVDYLDKFELPPDETPLSQVHRRRALKVPELKEFNYQGPGFDARYNLDHIFDDDDLITPVIGDSANKQPWEFSFDYPGNQSDWPELTDDWYLYPNQEADTCLFENETSSPSQNFASLGAVLEEAKDITHVPLRKTVERETVEPPATVKKAPTKSQWATLQELRLSSRAHYTKFLRLTGNNPSRGIKMLRRMYGSAKGMLDTGITTFGNVLDGKEPQSLKDIFAFTCLSYIMAKLLQKHGQMEGVQPLADTERWRLAIRKEKDRLVYDQVVRILWPEIEFFKDHSKEEGSTPAPDSHQTQPPTGPKAPYVPSSFLAYSMATSSDMNFLERARVADSISIQDCMQFAFQGPETLPDINNQPVEHGFLDNVMGLLQETSTHEDFMFADFSGIFNPQLEIITIRPEEQLADIMSTTHPPERPPQTFPPNGEGGTIDPSRLSKSHPPIAGCEVPGLPEVLSPKMDEAPPVSSLLERLKKTIMFQVVVAFVNFISSLGELLFLLSGYGITSRRKKHETESYTRPFQECGEFVTGVMDFVIEPIKKDFGEANELVNAVLCMADTFIRLGRLQSVREIEEYIITTARNLACNYASFVALVSKTLRQCLSASDRMTWDHTYPAYSTDQEDYSSNYVKKIEAIAVEWATETFKKEDDNSVDLTTINVIQTAEPLTGRRESTSSSNSDSHPSKKRKLSPLSPTSSTDNRSSTTPASSTDGDHPNPIKAYCHYAPCKKSYNGKEAHVNLRRHIRLSHEQCKAIQCPKCGHNSPRRDNVRKHFLAIHKGEELPAALKCKTRA